MSDSRIIWERYQKLNEANLISKDPLHLELENILKQKNVNKQEIANWFLNIYIKWFQSSKDDDQKISFIKPYKAKETDPEWAKKEGIVQFKGFTSRYKNTLNHIIDFLNTKDDNYLKSLFKVTVPQIFEEVQKWDQEMADAAEKAKKNKINIQEGIDYNVIGVYDGYPVWQLISNKAFREESMFMGNCVGQAARESRVTKLEGGMSEYFIRYKKGEIAIFSLRKPKEYNQPAVTFELNRQEDTSKIVQIKGANNQAPVRKYWKVCKDFIQDNDLIVRKDGHNIGMINLSYTFLGRYNDRYYFDDDKEFEDIIKRDFLQKQKASISSIMSRIKDGVIDGPVFLSSLLLKELPDLSKIKVTGNFICGGNILTSLKGSPHTVEGKFKCNNNILSNLEGAPSVVNGDFDCQRNMLTNLNGSPNTVGGTFNCESNNLVSLEGAPSVVNGNFDCNRNKLTSLKGIPHTIRGKFVFSSDEINFTDQDIQEAMQNSKEQNTTKLESFKQFYTESCWKNYKQVGMKPKGKGKKKRMVPNCVPK